MFEVKKSEKSVKRGKTILQSDGIMQNILNASKLLEGRITFDELLKLDIPTFESIVDNEFSNIDQSYSNFKEHGIIDAYTKGETTDIDNKFLKDISKQTQTN